MLRKIIGLSLICLLIVVIQLTGAYAKENLVFMDGCEFVASSTYFENSDLARTLSMETHQPNGVAAVLAINPVTRLLM